MKRPALCILVLFLNSFTLFAQDEQNAYPLTDSLLDRMSIPEKIGQLFMVAAYSNQGESHLNYLYKLIEEQHIGGVIMMKGDTAGQQQLLQQLQSRAPWPLLVGQDAEWGQAMRLEDAFKFPTSLTVGAGSKGDLTYDLGEALAHECQRYGVHLSFSPVLDVNTNAQNPIIGARSFGSDVHNVQLQGRALISGMQRNGVLACGKHFPGHGDTHQDSHKTLPKIDKTLEELRAVDWVPFQQAVEAHVASMMVAHLNIPALEPGGRPTSLSKAVVTDLLREEWGYDGLIITDALNMQGARSFTPPGQVALEAFLAGNDILLFPEDVSGAAASIAAALESGKISLERLDESVRRILRAKEQSRAWEDWRAAQKGQLVSTLRNLHPDQAERNERLVHRLIDGAITALPEGTAPYPVEDLRPNFVHLSLGDEEGLTTLNDALDHYVEMAHVGPDAAGWEEVEAADILLVSFHQNTTNPWRRYELNAAEQQAIRRADALGKPIYYLHFANPYGVLSLPKLTSPHRVVIAYENNAKAKELLPQKLFGARPTLGRLSCDLNAWGKAGDGIQAASLGRLRYGPAWEVGVQQKAFEAIDSTVLHAIEGGATPGAQVLVARGGQVVFERSYGSHTYGGEAVQWTDLYDLASITKITATLPGLMQWYEKQPLLLESTLGNHTRRLDGSDKADLVLEDVLAHQSGLPAWIPFYLETQSTDSARAYWYLDHAAPDYTQVMPNLFVRSAIRDTMYKRLADCELNETTYRYSDLGYYLFMEMLEERFNESLDRWVRNSFYLPLGARRLTYEPLNHGYKLSEIVPTEEDGYWRHQRVHGTVHDMGAALLGGVAGHAGLFSNANDLAKMMQMYLNGGSYGGQSYFKPSTVERFSRCAFCEQQNRRGLGFDRPQLNDGPGPSCTCASDLSFGHTGFTGTMVWMDPEEELLYIFLSNRTYPDAENWKLSRWDVRTDIQQIIYNALQ